MEITEKQISAAYEVADENTKKVLDALFGKKKDNRPVTERVKTFEDACRELGDNHPFVEAWRTCSNAFGDDDKDFADVLAYLKLRIIVAALNEGWEPKFEEEEYRWAPWYCLYTKEEWEDLDDDVKAKGRVVGRSYYDASAYGGVVYADAYYASSYSPADIGSRLAFKSEALAKYAGEQFIDIYIDFMMSNVKA
ncbi:MAG: hypothetical protein SPJ13_01245 [Bacteroidales bacterium]|nr:hypothetical protein [Bacteroidales bacterium]